MREQWLCMMSGVALLAAACSATAPTGAHGQGAGAANGGGVSGSGAGSTGAADSGFGNGSGNNYGDGGLPNTSGDAACAVGAFCASNMPDPTNCGSETLKGDVKMIDMPGNVLMIFDRSGSMSQVWTGGKTPKWQAAGGAMISALMPLQDKLTIGAVFFPNNAFFSCSVDPITNMDQIAFMPGAMALAKMQAAAPSGTPTPLYSATIGQTPTLEALQAADVAISTATLKGATAVILVTDGDPNCKWDQTMAVNIVTAWAAKGIKTYALGVPGVGGTGAQNLNTLAMAGGTMQYIAPTDATTLQMKIQEIVQQTVSVGFDNCVIHLDKPTSVPDKLHLVVTSKGVDQDVPHTFSTGEKAWTISADGGTVELLGNLCAAAKNGTYEKIDFKFGCVELPAAPPPPVPQ